MSTTSSNISGGNRKGGGAREWVKNKLKSSSQLLVKLADKALAALPALIPQKSLRKGFAFNPKQARLFEDWYGQILPPLCNFCLNGTIHLNFSM